MGETKTSSTEQELCLMEPCKNLADNLLNCSTSSFNNLVEIWYGTGALLGFSSCKNLFTLSSVTSVVRTWLGPLEGMSICTWHYLTKQGSPTLLKLLEFISMGVCPFLRSYYTLNYKTEHTIAKHLV